MKKTIKTEIELDDKDIKTAIVDYLENSYNFTVEIKDVKTYCGDEGNVYSQIKSINEILI